MGGTRASEIANLDAHSGKFRFAEVYQLGGSTSLIGY
jgi:hypothetical protein